MVYYENNLPLKRELYSFSLYFNYFDVVFYFSVLCILVHSEAKEYKKLHFDVPVLEKLNVGSSGVA